MQAIIQIGKYIVENNVWWKIPSKCLMAVFWQLEKRIIKNVRIKKLFNKKKMYLYHNTPSASCVVYADMPDKPCITKLRKLATPDTIFLDIGANIGFYSLMMMDAVKSVYAFEAHPETARLLTNNFVLNHIDPHFVINKAVSDKAKKIKFTNYAQGSPVNHLLTEDADRVEPSISVEAMALDDFVVQQRFLATQAFILKIDVEGAEMDVLAGARYFLEKYNIRGILFENLSETDHSVSNQLIALGFTIKQLSKHNYIAEKSAHAK